MPEGDKLIEQRDHHVVARLGQVGIEVDLGLDLSGEGVRVPRRRFRVGRGQHRQATDLLVEQDCLALVGQRELDEPLAGLRRLRAGDERDVRGHDRRHGRIDELDRHPGVLRGEAEEIDHEADAVLAVGHAVGHAEAALGDRRAVAGDREELRPALPPALALQDGLDGEVRRSRPRRTRDRDVAVVDRIDEIGPLFRLGQLVRREIARVPHDPVAGERLAEVETLRIVDRVVADPGGNRGVLRVGLLQELRRRQHLEGVRRRCPEDLRPAADRLLAHERNAGRGVLVQDLELVVRVPGLERLLVGRRQFLRERRDDRHRLRGGGKRERRSDKRGGEAGSPRRGRRAVQVR